MIVKAIKSFVNQLYSGELIRKLDEGKDEKDKICKKYWKKRRGMDEYEDLEEVDRDREPKTMVKRELVVAENEMERMIKRVKSKTT